MEQEGTTEEGKLKVRARGRTGRRWASKGAGRGVGQGGSTSKYVGGTPDLT
jgi:hypothetical protein